MTDQLGVGQRLNFIMAVGVLTGLLCPGIFVRDGHAGARNPCLEPGNLVLNCGFDTFVEQWAGSRRLLVPTHWAHFVLTGEPDFRNSTDTYWGAPSLWLLTDGQTFTAGVYQQISVTPGVVYQADIGWAAATVLDFERKLGLDPTGGTDPSAPSVIWGPAEWGINPWPDLTVSARAAGQTMTVFVWVAHPVSHGNDWIFLDAVGLWPDASQPAATISPTPSATPTRKPPTRTPRPPTVTPQPTATPIPPSATPTDSPTIPPTHTPTPTPTATWTATPTPEPPTSTPSATVTPSRTALAVSLLVGTPDPFGQAALSKAGRQEGLNRAVLLYVALGSTGLAVLLALAIIYMGRRSRVPG